MKITITDENELDRFTIWHKCHTLHQNKPIANGSKALCTQCGGILYHRNIKLIQYGLALSLAGLIFFGLANLFPLVSVSIVAEDQALSILSMIMQLINGGYYIVGFFVGFLIFLFPLMIFLIYFALFFSFHLKKGEELTKDLLILLAFVLPWNMSDVFLISILVALVKLFGMIEVHIGVSFWTFIIFVILDIYMTRNIHIGELWHLRKELFGGEKK